MKLFDKIPDLGTITDEKRKVHNISLHGDEDAVWITLDNLGWLRDYIEKFAEDRDSLLSLLERSKNTHESEFNTRTGYGLEKENIDDSPSTSTGGRALLHDYILSNIDSIIEEESLVNYLEGALHFKKGVGIDTINDFLIMALLEKLSAQNIGYINYIKERNNGILPNGIEQFDGTVGGSNISLISIDGQKLSLLPIGILGNSNIIFKGLEEGDNEKFKKVFALKKEMLKKGVEKRMITTIINKVIKGSSINEVLTKSNTSKTNTIINDNGLTDDIEIILGM